MSNKSIGKGEKFFIMLLLVIIGVIIIAAFVAASDNNSQDDNSGIISDNSSISSSSDNSGSSVNNDSSDYSSVSQDTDSTDSSDNSSVSSSSDSSSNSTSVDTDSSDDSSNTSVDSDSDSNDNSYGTVINTIADGDSIKQMSAFPSSGDAYNSIIPYACYSGDTSGTPDSIIFAIDVSGDSKSEIASKYLVDSALLLTILSKNSSSFYGVNSFYFVLSVDGTPQDNYIEYDYDSDSGTYTRGDTVSEGPYANAIYNAAANGLNEANN